MSTALVIGDAKLASIEVNAPRRIERLDLIAKLALEDNHVTGELRSKLVQVMQDGSELSMIAGSLKTIPTFPVKGPPSAGTPFAPVSLPEALVYFGRMAIFRALRPLSEQDPFEGPETCLTREILTRLATAAHRRSSGTPEQLNRVFDQVLGRGVQGLPLSDPSTNLAASQLRDAVARCVPRLIDELRTTESEVLVGLRAAGIIPLVTIPPHRIIRLARIQLEIRKKKKLLPTTDFNAAASSSTRQSNAQWRSTVRSFKANMPKWRKTEDKAKEKGAEKSATATAGQKRPVEMTAAERLILEDQERKRRRMEREAGRS